jgi:hypothetical protein
MEAFRIALVEITCLGPIRTLDLTGYPHEDEQHAMLSDWQALGVDLKAAAQKIEAAARVTGGDSDGSAGGTAEAKPGSGTKKIAAR